jgi:hypothetical protein
MQFPDFRGVHGRGCRPTQPFSVRPCMLQARPRSFPQNLPFELSENRKQPGHGSTGRGGQVQRLGERHEANAQMFEFLERCQQICHRTAPAVQPPDQHDVDFPAASGLEQFLTNLSPHCTGTDLADLQGNRSAASGGILPHGATLHRKGLLIARGNAGVQAGSQHFRRPSYLAKNVFRFCLLGSPFSGHFSMSPTHGRSRSFSARAAFILLCRRGCGESSQCVAVVPWHPCRGLAFQLRRVSLQLGEIVEGIDAVQLAGVNQAHE